MITEDAVDSPARSPDQLGGMVTCVMALSWEDVAAACGGASVVMRSSPTSWAPGAPE